MSMNIVCTLIFTLGASGASMGHLRATGESELYPELPSYDLQASLVFVVM